jgi:hypothetical protein
LTFLFSAIFAAIITKSNNMKRIVTLITVIALGSALSANAQEPITSKKGTVIPYETGEWGIAIDANPFFNYLGNFFNNTSGNSGPDWSFANNDNVIHFFMIQDPNTAWRAKVRIGLHSDKDIFTASDDLDTTAGTTGSVNPIRRRVEDELKTSSRNIVLGFGIQKMRGKHRVRGIYGAEAQLGFGGSKREVTYGNAISNLTTDITDPTPTANSVLESIVNPSGTYGRVTEIKGPNTFSFGVRGFIGAEYFVAPKISIAGEFGWGIGITSSGETEVTTEYATFDTNPTSPTYGNFTGIGSTTIVDPGKSSSFDIDTDNASGNIRLGFYF